MMSALTDRFKVFGDALMSVQPGFPPISAAAICGNAGQESLCRPIAPSSDGSDGVLQWRNATDVSRLTAMKEWCASHGQDWQTLQAQAAFTIYELHESYPGLLQQLMTPGPRTLANLTANFMEIYERPSPVYANLDARIKYAVEAYSVLCSSGNLAPSSTVHVTVPVSPPLAGVSNPELDKMFAAILPLLASALEPLIVSGVKQLLADAPKVIADFQAKQPQASSAQQFNLPLFGEHILAALISNITSNLPKGM